MTEIHNMPNYNHQTQSDSPVDVTNEKGSTETSSIGKSTVGGVQVNNKDDIESAKNTTNTSNSTAAGPIDHPKIPLPGPHNLTQADASELAKYFSSTFMVATTEAFVSMIMANKDIHKAEGELLVQMLGEMWKSAVALGALQLARAETEAAMHMAQAIGGFAGLGVAALGTALSIGGKATANQAKNAGIRMDEGLPAKQPKTDKTAGAGADPSIAPTEGKKPVQKPKPADDASTESVTSTSQQSKADRTKADSEADKVKSNIDSSETNKAQAKSRVQKDEDANVSGEGSLADDAASRSTTSRSSSSESSNSRSSSSSSSEESSSSSTASRADDVKGPETKTAETRQDRDTRLKTEAKEKEDAKVANRADDEKTLEAKVDERVKLSDKETKGEMIADLGAGITQMAMPLNQVVDNFIQMYYKPILGQYDQQIELARAIKDIVTKAFESASAAMSSASQEGDTALQALKKTSDDTQQAFKG